ncbi:hypothetical protein JG687_00008430 [Phytophthora cactorum]|uniref:RING-type domain-containing protein n=1 Tax=Phytophthora cactorum TaxID=29920 RepID=A0A8T1UEU4_9STRA|nr:hypothetical protein JG687_00008430 [Phytophthora cactorum]
MVDADVYFGDDFGQKIDLTVRIREILRNYPEGTSIFKEMVQNADDAGATEVNLCLDYRQHAATGLAYEKLASFQGPSLLVHNNATFSDADFQSIQRIGDSLKKDNSKGWKTGRFGVGFNSVYHVTDLPAFVSGSQLVFFDPQYNDAEFSDGDFINLARIGQASKLQRAATTGRFGLGFNSVYHFTDLPSIVSAKSIVMFDPHATHLPGISAVNPGIKIRFANASIVKQFPDQFAPFKGVFGCDLEHHYKGTLFRFPLRDSSLAESSEIKRRGYSHREIVELFKSFQASIIDTLLFLRNVRKVEVYYQPEIDQPPVLLYDAEVPKEDHSEISAQVAEAFQASATEQERKMAGMEAERKRLMELSSAKLKKDDDLADESSDEEDSGEVDDGEDVANDSESVSASDDGSSGGDEIENTSSSSSQGGESNSSAGGLSESEDGSGEIPLSPGSLIVALENVSNYEDDAYDLNGDISEGFAVPVYPVEDESPEFCSRETIHNVLLELNVSMMELAYLGCQERDIVPRSAEVGLVVLDGIFASVWEELAWEELTETHVVLIAEFFAHNGETNGGYNRVQLEKLKQLPIFVNIRNNPCAIHGGQDFFLIPPDLNLTDIPLPPDAQKCFLKSNPRLNAFYKDLGVDEMSDSKLLIYVLPMFNELLESQRDQVMHILLQKWQSLRGNAELAALLKTSALFRDDESEDASYRPASAYCDPRNKVLATIYAGVRGQFPAQRYRTPEWLDLMGEIGLQTEVTVDIFVECAQRIDGQFSGKQALSPEDEHLITTLHEFFVQNFDKFDRSRSFFERITPLSFVPAVVYENVLQSSNGGAVDSKREGQFTSRSVVRKYSDCATPDDQALVYSTMPILANVALPTRVLYSRLGIKSPPPQDQVVRHLLSITNGDRAMSSRSLDWQFFLPMVEVFQVIFKFLQENWGELRAETQQRLANAAVIPVGSTLVKGSRLFFHLGENLAPLMFEVPRVFGAYDTLFRHMGSKEAPEVSDYIRLLRDLKEECCDHPLNLNELIAAARAIDLFVAAMVESNYRLSLEEKNSIFLPSGTAVMQSMLVMAFNDSASLCSGVDLTELHVVHPRISTRCCKMLGVRGITSIVTEELDGGENPTELLASDDIAHFNSVLASQQFADGLRKIITAQQQKASSYDAFGFIPDFEDLNQRIMNLATYEVKCVAELHSRFIAKLEFPARRIDVTKTERQSSLSFLDQTRRRIFITKRTLEAHSEMGMRASHLVARCINQLLGGVLQDCSVLESILTCDEMEIPDVLQLLDIYEDPVLIVEKLRGVLEQPLCEADCANVELAPLRSCLPGELIAVEDENGTLCYGKILREEPSSVAGVSRYEVKVNSSSTRWMLATQLYFFRSARVGTSGSSASVRTGRQAENVAANHLENVALPASVVAIAPEAQGNEITTGFPSVNAPTAVVPLANVLSAVNDLLSRLNVTLDTSVEDLMAENLRLQRRLEVAEAGRRAAAAQIDTVIREKKEVQDSLVCAVCLENQVNRVLIPCGHIYCASCVQQLPRPSCPICRQNIVSSSVFHVPS